METLDLPDQGGVPTRVALIDLNPAVGEWFLLAMEPEGGGQRFYHLEAPEPLAEINLDPAFPAGLSLRARGGELVRCTLWDPAPGPLEAARASGHTYVPLCGQLLALRNPAQGHRSTLERATDFLRDNIWGGEQITVFVRETLYQDAFLSTGELEGEGTAPSREGPPAAALDPSLHGRTLGVGDLGLPLEDAPEGRVVAGGWYPVKGAPGMFGGVMQPRLVDPAIVLGQGDRVDELDEVELSANVYLVGFQLDRFEIGFELGTDHPRVEWSERAPAAARIADLTGPDGFETIAPLVRTGQVDPDLVSKLAATMVGGFKRSHGAFKAGELARVNEGSHYGFLSHGVVLSKLQPGLATFLGFEDGTVDIRPWSAEMEADLWKIRFARQNGVPILEEDSNTRLGVPGTRLKGWAAGNWSGSADGKLRSVRGGLCIVDDAGGPFLIYAYFSSATPSAMARVFAAYGCRDAMLLDMNALEHTYMAAYLPDGASMGVHHLVHGMEVLDLERKGVLLPRFVGFPDSRDFFYVLRKEGP